ncbi:hypothetical protein [Leptolyngbya iicbica]|uniref:Uncharacterized protein n=1 Tax=Lyngbya confervoides BDU141951 TaxID=1574623 RepID=A0A8T6QW33_9CYAN|nr:hypothetical protein [Leptolyngbya sp. LK]
MADAAATRVITLKQAFRVGNLGALTRTDLDRYYVDLSAVRRGACRVGVGQM